MRHLSASVLIAGSACWLDFVGHFDAQNSAFGGLLNTRTASAMVAQGHEGTKIGVKYGSRLGATSAISYLIYSIPGKTRRLNFDLTPIPPDSPQLGPPLPGSWISAGMKNSENHNATRLGTVVNAVRKSRCDNATNAVVNNAKSLRLFCRKRDATFNFCDELYAEIGLPSFIPSRCLNQLRTGCAAKGNRQTHCPIWARAEALTSLHGTTSSGLASWSARRLSSSAFWVSVGPGAALCFAMPSQSASTNSSWSWMLS